MTTAFAAIASTLRARSGLALGQDKLYLLETRLAPLMKREGVRTLDELAARLRPGSALEGEMVEAMTTNESLFFRDGKPFDTLRHIVLPRLHAARPAGAALRIWSAATANGQEAYSIAMVAAEMAPLLAGTPIEIVATDIAREPLARARQGLYSHFEVQRGVPTNLLVKYFTKQGQQWRVRQPLRDMVSFCQWNLLSDLRALGVFDVVFCRNVLIYFDAPTKTGVLDAIARQLQPDGTLFLGGSETVPGISEALCARDAELGYRPRGRLQPAA